MGDIREMNRDCISPFKRNAFFKALNIISIYDFNAIFRQPRVHPIFRLQKNTFKAIDDFRNSTKMDQIITLIPAKDT